ncbi:SLAP domain-containing protein [Lactobacillus crispatus]|uniref:SLAP domain-containing protein n=1 Tax=Lactobacillus crispatus TaxID=47770 RepID=UPI001F0D894A|nr:SLAP domain-containing protein [Lactobacillus crispatus]
MKKNVLVSLSVATLLSVGAVGVNEVNGVANNTNVVQAAVKNGKLTHNAYIYKSNGNRYGKKVLKKGKTVKILGTKKIYGKKYYRIGKNQYVKVANFANNATDTAVGNTTDKSTSNSNNSSENKHNSSDSKSAAEKAGEKGYIYFTDDQVAQIQSYLWQRINAYRQSKGYPAYKTNPELTSFVNRVMQKGTPEYNVAGYGNGTIQNTDTLGQFLPKLEALGMDSARSMTDLDAFAYGNLKQWFLDLKAKDPKKVADEIFNVYTKQEDGMDLRTLEGHKDKYAYAALKVKYNGEGDYIDHCLELNFTVVGSYSPEWIKAWEAAK